MAPDDALLDALLGELATALADVVFRDRRIAELEAEVERLRAEGERLRATQVRLVGPRRPFIAPGDAHTSVECESLPPHTQCWEDASGMIRWKGPDLSG